MLLVPKAVLLEVVPVLQVSINESFRNAFPEFPEWLEQGLNDGTVTPKGTSGRVVGGPYWTFEVWSGGNRAVAAPGRFLARYLVSDGLEVYFGDKTGIFVAHEEDIFNHYIQKENNAVPTTPNEAPIGHPEPPHDTDLGNDSTPAPELAEVAEDQIVAEEVSTDE